MKRRLSKVRSTLASLGLDGFLVTFLPHIRYLTGFTGSNGLLCYRQGRWYFITDARYRAQSRSEVQGCKNEVDRVARKSLGNDRLTKYFVHPVGHGIGLQVHEPPILSSANPYVLAAGNVVTIEPGAYIPGECGIRIEDDVVVEKWLPRNDEFSKTFDHSLAVA
jgi:Xaa-Pro aminopeptidase